MDIEHKRNKTYNQTKCLEDVDNVNNFLLFDTPNTKTHNLFFAIKNLTLTTAYQDLTGRFPVQSSRGNNYILVCYSYNLNIILAHPLCNRRAPDIVKGWQTLNEHPHKAGVQPERYIFDNEWSVQFNSALQEKNSLQLVPPHIHRHNAVKRAIQTFKPPFGGAIIIWYQFTSLWVGASHTTDRSTLNLLCNDRSNPKLSAHAFLFSNFDYNKSPMVPPGTSVLVHAKSRHCATWVFHGKDAWVIGHTPSHYRCIHAYIPVTRAEINCDTLEFFPHIIPSPQVKTEDFLWQATSDIVSLLTNPITHLPFLEAGNSTLNALLKIAQLLNRSIDQVINLDKIWKSLPASDEIHSSATTIIQQTPLVKPQKVPKTITIKPLRVQQSPWFAQ